MQLHRLFFLAGALGAVLALSACEASVPSRVQAGKMRVKEQIVTETLDMAHPDAERLDTIAKNILNNGRGEVSLTIPYLKGDIPAAGRKGAMYIEEFGKRGVKIWGGSISLTLVPDKKYANKAVLVYPAMVALPAKGCKRIPGYQGADTLDTAQAYDFGCEHQAVLSKMIADPSDLLGRDDAGQDGDSARNAVVIEAHKTGKPNGPMGGYSVGGGN